MLKKQNIMQRSKLHNRISVLCLALLFISLSGCGFVEETSFLTGSSGPTRSDIPWWDESWSYRRMLTLDNSGQSEDLAEFPVLVRLASSRITYASVQDGGEDLRFIASDGSTVLSHEIELWNESGESIVWVKVPQIDGLSDSGYIMMYYGNDGVIDGQDAQGVWDADFFLVWHCNQQPAGGEDILDSTISLCNGRSTNMEAEDRVASYIGYGLDLDGSNEWIDPEGPLDLGFFHDLDTYETFEVWIKADDTSSDQTLFEEGGSTNGFLVGLDADTVRFATRDSSSQVTVNTPFVDTASFHYIACTFDDGTLSSYLDASPQSQAAGYGTIGSHTGEPGMGCSADSDAVGHSSAGYYFNGIIDELRLSGVARTADWVAAQHLSVSDSFITFGDEEY
jgi:biopolymer transport protein ExbB